MDTELKIKLLGVVLVASLFITGLSTLRAARNMEQEGEQSLSTLNYEIGVHDKLLERYGEKIEAIDSRTIRLEAAVDTIKGQISLLDWIFGTCLLMIAGALGHTIYQRVILSRAGSR